MSNLPDDVSPAHLDAALGVPAYDTEPYYAEWLDDVLELLGDDDADRATLHAKGAKRWYHEFRAADHFADWMREQKEEPRSQSASTAERIAGALADGSVDDPDWQVYPTYDQEDAMTAQQTRLDRLVRELRRADEGNPQAKIEARELIFRRPYDCRNHQAVPQKRLGPWGWAVLVAVWLAVMLVRF